MQGLTGQNEVKSPNFFGNLVAGMANNPNSGLRQTTEGAAAPGGSSPTNNLRGSKQKRFTTINGVRTEVDELGRPIRPADLAPTAGASNPLVPQGIARPSSPPRGSPTQKQLSLVRQSAAQGLGSYKLPLKGAPDEPRQVTPTPNAATSPAVLLSPDHPFTAAQLERINKYKNDSTLEDADEAAWTQQQSLLEADTDPQPEVFVPRKNSFGSQPLPTTLTGNRSPWLEQKQTNIPSYRVPVPSSNYIAGLSLPEPVVFDARPGNSSFAINPSARPSMITQPADGPVIIRSSQIAGYSQPLTGVSQGNTQQLLQQLTNVKPPLRTSRPSEELSESRNLSLGKPNLQQASSKTVSPRLVITDEVNASNKQPKLPAKETRVFRRASHRKPSTQGSKSKQTEDEFLAVLNFKGDYKDIKLKAAQDELSDEDCNGNEAEVPIDIMIEKIRNDEVRDRFDQPISSASPQKIEISAQEAPTSPRKIASIKPQQPAEAKPQTQTAVSTGPVSAVLAGSVLGLCFFALLFLLVR